MTITIKGLSLKSNEYSFKLPSLENISNPLVIPISNIEGLYFIPYNNELHCFDSITGWNVFIESLSSNPNLLLSISKELLTLGVEVIKEVVWYYEPTNKQWKPDHIRGYKEQVSYTLRSKINKKHQYGALSTKGLVGTYPNKEDMDKIESLFN
jgi:hypothetical protein